MQNCQANTKKIFTKFFWRAGKVMITPENFIYFELIRLRSGPGNQTKERSVDELFAGAFRNKISM